MSKHADIIRKIVADGWQVNEQGQVIKPDGTIKNLSLRKGYPNRIHPGSRTDYMKFTVKHEGISYPVSVHKLVCYLNFGEKCLKSGVHARHLDNDSMNNCPVNIGIGSGTDNIMDRPKTERQAHASKAAATLRRFSNQEVVDIREIPESTCNLTKLLNISKSTISDIRNRRTYKNVK